MISKELNIIVAGIVLSYVLFFAFTPLVSGIVNNHFYDGESLYRLTWSHYVLPAAGAISVVLIINWFLQELNWPRKLEHYAVFFFAALLFTYFGFVLGVYAYGYTFLSQLQLFYFFLFTPFWAVVPGIIAGWLAALLLYYKQ